MNESRLTRSQAAAALGVTVKTLYTWEKEGRIPPPERDWRGWRWYTPPQMEALRAYQRMRHPHHEAPPSVAEGGPPPMEISARNRLAGTIKSVRGDGLLAEIVLDLGHGNEIVAVITQGSVERLGLRVGEKATALIKATEVLIGR